jgi:hypothetical protein
MKASALSTSVDQKARAFALTISRCFELPPQDGPLLSVELGGGFDSFKGTPRAKAIKNTATTNGAAASSESDFVKTKAANKFLTSWGFP